RSPWIEQRSVAGGEAADAVPALPHRDASPLDDLRQPVDTKPQRPHRRSRLRELSFADPRIESSVGPDVYEVADAHTALFAARALDAGARAPGDGAAGSPAAACALRDGGGRIDAGCGRGGVRRTRQQRFRRCSVVSEVSRL